MYAAAGKPILDRVMAVIALVALLPLFMVLAILIKLSSPGPVLYTQQRVGRNQRVFNLYKFRTMSVDSDRVITQTYGSSDGVTALGRWLRRLKIDELPQLINVLVGDMSVVGPRPCLVSHLSKLNEAGLRRFVVLPGLTGLAQVNGNINLTWPERWEYDARYADSLSFLLDIRIILKTFLVVVRGEHRFKQTVKYEDNSDRFGQ